MSISEIDENELPNGWTTATFDDVLLVMRNGTTFKQNQEKLGIPVSRIETISNSKIDITKVGYIHNPPQELIENYCLKEGDILFSHINSPSHLGKTACFNNEFTVFLHGMNLMLLRANSRLIYYKFLHYFCFYHRVAGGFSKIAQNAVNQASINQQKLKNISLSLAPLNEQKRIVSKIEELFSKLDAGIAALERVQVNLKRYRAAVLKAAVEGQLTEDWRKQNPNTEPASKLLQRILKERRQKWESEQLEKYQKSGKTPPKDWQSKYKEPSAPDTANLPSLPDGWCWASIDQISEVQGGIQKQPSRTPQNNAYPYLRVANVYRDRLDLSEVHLMELYGDELEKLRLQKDDLLIVEGNGSRSEIGRSALWLGEIENCVHQNHIIRVRFLAGKSGYLNLYWNSPEGTKKISEKAASTSGLYTLSVSKITSIPVPLPPLSEQSEIINIADNLTSLISQTELSLQKDKIRASRLRQSILKQAFSGKLVPQDPNDEPASVLLQRIQAEKANTIKAKPAKRQRKKVNEDN